MRIALIHDMLTQNGGAERVLHAFQEIWPAAPIYTLIYNKNKVGQFFNNSQVITSFVQKIPWAKKKYQWYLPFMPHAIESFNLDDYEVILSSASALAKGIKTKKDTLHICYCHTPTRYLWFDADNYLRHLPYPRFIKTFLPIILKNIKDWDYRAAQQVNKFIANSETVKNRIVQYYQRDSVVIHPPVAIDKFKISETLGNYFLIGGRLVPYKRYDLAVKAFTKLNIPLKIFGSGQEMRHLKSMAGPKVEFLGEVAESEKAALYSQARAFIHPQEEDFGITAVESMAAGRPVIAYKAGGALETVIDGVNGVFFEEQSWEALANTVIHFKAEEFDSSKIRESVLKFDTAHFKEKIRQFVTEKWQEFIQH